MRLFRRFFRGEDTGSMPLAMLLTLVGTSLSTLTVPVVIGQLRATAETMERAKSLHAAQAGIDVVIGGIRASAGSVAKLPCFPAANPSLGVTGDPLIGVIGAGLPGRYRVSVQFQNAAKQPLPCASRSTRLTSVPSYAVITSIGTVQGKVGDAFLPGASRTLSATYVFRFTNENIEGGLVKLSGGVYCLDAGSGAPAVGTNVTIQPCNSGSSRQTFAYTKSLAMLLVSSKTAANPLGMCLDSGATQATGVLVQFRVCGYPTIPFHQRWSINDGSNLQSTDPGGSALGVYCFHAKAAAANSFVEIIRCNAGGASTFAPEASVGAGAAGPPAQLVNFKQFGRCVDVTNFNPAEGFLIVWPCKQAPNPVDVGWNQRYTVPTTGTGLGNITGQISTYDGKTTPTTWCLTTAEPGAASHFVTVKKCPLSTDITTQWTVSYQEKTYGASFVIKDHNGSCLSPADLDDKNLPAGDIFKGSTTVSKLIVAACDGTKLQKWNAPANIEDPSPLKNIGER